MLDGFGLEPLGGIRRSRSSWTNDTRHRLKIKKLLSRSRGRSPTDASLIKQSLHKQSLEYFINYEFLEPLSTRFPLPPVVQRRVRSVVDRHVRQVEPFRCGLREEILAALQYLQSSFQRRISLR